MGKAETRSFVAGSMQWWRWALVAVVMLSLVVTLATRTFPGTISHNTAVQSGASQAMRQHMDRDAVRWVVPVLQLTVLLVPVFYLGAAPAAPRFSALRIEPSLYNRPPPAC